MSHDLADSVTQLGSLLGKLPKPKSGLHQNELIEVQDRLAKLELVVIVKDLKAEHADYKAALQGLNEAIAFIGNATQDIGKVVRAIHLAATAATWVEQAAKTAAA